LISKQPNDADMELQSNIETCPGQIPFQILHVVHLPTPLFAFTRLVTLSFHAPLLHLRFHALVSNSVRRAIQLHFSTSVTRLPMKSKLANWMPHLKYI